MFRRIRPETSLEHVQSVFSANPKGPQHTSTIMRQLEPLRRRRFVYPLKRPEKVGQRAVTLTAVPRQLCQRILGLVDVPVEGQQPG